MYPYSMLSKLYLNHIQAITQINLSLVIEIRLLCDSYPNSNDKAMELGYILYPGVIKKLTHLVGTSDIACVMCN